MWLPVTPPKFRRSAPKGFWQVKLFLYATWSLCESLHKCHVCHHTLLHVEKTDSPSDPLLSHLILLWRFERTPWHATSRWSPRMGLLSMFELSSTVPLLHRSSLNVCQELWTYLVPGKKLTFLELLASPRCHLFSQSRASVSALCTHQDRETIDVVAIVSLMVTCDRAYAGVVYLRLMDTNGHIHTSFVIAKTNGSSSVEQDYSHNFSIIVKWYSNSL